MNKGKTIFSQIMKFLPAYEFQRSVLKYGGEYKVKEFSCLEQFYVMAFAQIAYRESLRDTVTCLGVLGPRLYHMGIRNKPSLNNLSHANMTRDWRIFAEVAQVLICRARKLHEDEQISEELEQAVYALDSTTIDLCLSLFRWARFRKRKGAIKLHTLMEVKSSMPTVIYITDGKVHDMNMLDILELEPGAIYIMDRGYVDFRRLYQFCLDCAFFVIRAKRNLRYHVVKKRRACRKDGIISDQVIHLHGYYQKRHYPTVLRRIKYWDREKKKRLVFLTNNFNLPAKTIAFLYRCRWRIEIFFKWIKQNLRIKTFFGTTENAVKTQIWIAICVYAMVFIMQKELGIDKSAYEILQILNLTLFEKESLKEMLLSVNASKNESGSCKQLLLFN
ncbi:MAG TPA: IS4 family transposase [Lentisphaeria bacterium]|nr:MAG: transposase [Lentisphaerae bacterium GWF2_49_21]HBC86456.1 IS4 family transposase [Lentisphaeria bacterium]